MYQKGCYKINITVMPTTTIFLGEETGYKSAILSVDDIELDGLTLEEFASAITDLFHWQRIHEHKTPWAPMPQTPPHMAFTGGEPVETDPQRP